MLKRDQLRNAETLAAHYDTLQKTKRFLKYTEHCSLNLNGYGDFGLSPTREKVILDLVNKWNAEDIEQVRRNAEAINLDLQESKYGAAEPS